MCDADEKCDGAASDACPSDTVASGGTVCRKGSGDMCDPDEKCDGAATHACPSDTVASAGTLCRSANGDCDVAEKCTGTAKEAYPADHLQTCITDSSLCPFDVATIPPGPQ